LKTFFSIWGVPKNTDDKILLLTGRISATFTGLWLLLLDSGNECRDMGWPDFGESGQNLAINAKFRPN
jgi:hypothetical protein